MHSAEVIATMTRDEMIRFLESWGFRCDDQDSADELAEAVVHTCIFEGIDLHQLQRLRDVLSIVATGGIPNDFRFPAQLSAKIFQPKTQPR